MRTIRNGVFETNSSSVHALAIPKDRSCMPHSLNFGVGEFGWEYEEVYATEDYFWTAIRSLDNEGNNFKQRFLNIMAENNLQCDYDEKSNDFCIDHCDELYDFVEMLLNDQGKLFAFLYGGLVHTGSDNYQDWDEMESIYS